MPLILYQSWHELDRMAGIRKLSRSEHSMALLFSTYLGVGWRKECGFDAFGGFVLGLNLGTCNDPELGPIGHSPKS